MEESRDRLIRVLIAEDQAMMRGALALLLEMEPDIRVVSQVAEGTRVVEEAVRNRADVALLDIELPGASGLHVCARLRERLPDCEAVMVTTFGRPGYLRRAMEAGAKGFLVKDGPVEGLATAIRDVAAGKTVIDPDLAVAALSAGTNPLTDRERDVLNAAADGSTAAQIARRLHLSDSTVRNYLSSAIGKTRTRNRVAAINVARDNGWLLPADPPMQRSGPRRTVPGAIIVGGIHRPDRPDSTVGRRGSAVRVISAAIRSDVGR